MKALTIAILVAASLVGLWVGELRPACIDVTALPWMKCPP